MMCVIITGINTGCNIDTVASTNAMYPNPNPPNLTPKTLTPDTVASTNVMYLDSNNKTTKSEHEGVVAIIFHTTARHVAYLPVCTIKP